MHYNLWWLSLSKRICSSSTHGSIHVDCCPKCEGPCYKDKVNKVLPMKVLCHFLMIFRFQRMFKTPTMSKLMEWHSKNNCPDGLVKHHCDSKAWKHVDKKYPCFASDPRNVHLALTANGVNPYKLTQSTWSTWLVMLLNYDIPPWLTMNFFSIMFVLLISRKDLITLDNFVVYW